MKKRSLLAICLAVSVMLVAAPAFAQNTIRNVQSVVIEDFNDPEESRWIVRGSRFIADDYPQWTHVRAWPHSLYREEPEGQTLRSLGIQAAFNRRGYNYLEIIPARMNNETGELEPLPIPIPGLAESVNLWVWGSLRNYYLDVHFRDYRGIIHTQRFGDINFRGWRNLRISIPSGIPQTVEYVPQRRGLELVKFVLWTRPEERADEFFVYFDELRVMTDLFEERFDGEDLANPEFIRQVWGDGM